MDYSSCLEDESMDQLVRFLECIVSIYTKWQWNSSRKNQNRPLFSSLVRKLTPGVFWRVELFLLVTDIVKIRFVFVVNFYPSSFRFQTFREIRKNILWSKQARNSRAQEEEEEQRAQQQQSSFSLSLSARDVLWNRKCQAGSKQTLRKKKEIRPYVKNVSRKRKKRKRQRITHTMNDRRTLDYFPTIIARQRFIWTISSSSSASVSYYCQQTRARERESMFHRSFNVHSTMLRRNKKKGLGLTPLMSLITEHDRLLIVAEDFQLVFVM